MHQFLTVAAGTTGTGSFLESAMTYAPILLVFVAFYFVLIRPQQKKDKADREMRENLEIGDEIITAGGIVGRIVSIKDDTVLIETGSDRNKLRITKWAVSTNTSAAERVAAEKESRKKSKDSEEK